MKKHEMVLDFTSLLDVILIILFLVIGSMNGKAQKDAAKIDELEAANAELSEEIAQQATEIAGLTEDKEELTQKKAELEAQIEELDSRIEELSGKLETSEAEKTELTALVDQYKALTEQYAEYAKLDSVEIKAYSKLMENAVFLELNLVKHKTEDATTHETEITCEMSLYKDGSKLGSSIIIDPDRKLQTQNTATVKKWLNSLLETYVADNESSIAVVVISYDNSDGDTGISSQSVEVAKEAIYEIINNRSKSYDLYYTEDGTKYITE